MDSGELPVCCVASPALQSWCAGSPHPTRPPNRLAPHSHYAWIAADVSNNFNTVSTVGLKSAPVADALAGLEANGARYYRNKYSCVFTVESASETVPVSNGCRI